MAQTTYQSPVINTTPKEVAALDALAILTHHIRDGINGTGAYTNIHLLSAVFDQGGTNRITIILTNPLPADQVARYNLTQTSP